MELHRIPCVKRNRRQDKAGWRAYRKEIERPIYIGLKEGSEREEGHVCCARVGVGSLFCTALTGGKKTSIRTKTSLRGVGHGKTP
jgi:hypothetical protein